jgi:FKBP-type peptidyl-prolyl cis-trans isomerase FklB
MKNELEKLSYSIGVNIGMSMKPQGIEEIDVQLLSQAINDVLEGNKLKMDHEEVGNTLRAHFANVQAKQHEAVIKGGKEFLAANSKNEGIVTLASGLQYQILKEGKGIKPTIDSTVTTHYHGMTIDGSVFDSSVQRGTPASFPVNGVISGWTEALQLMPLGSKWKLFIPSELAYGANGAGDAIGPHATLIFEVELLEIN